jgi:hypothetical protein
MDPQGAARARRASLVSPLNLAPASLNRPITESMAWVTIMNRFQPPGLEWSV